MSDKNFKVKKGLEVGDGIVLGTGVADTSIDFSAKKDGVALPSGLDVDRPLAPSGGIIRYNTENTHIIEAYFQDISQWVNISEVVAPNIVEDTTPQLGGGLDTNGNIITTISNLPVVIDPDGSGNIELNSQNIEVGEYVQHSGDIDTYIRFLNNEMRYFTGGAQRLRLTNVGMELTTGVNVNAILDEDNMSSNSSTALATQQSIKAYVDPKLDSSAYTAADVLAKIKTVDGVGSGLNANLLDNYSATSAGSPSTIALRNTGGDITTRLFRSEYTPTNATVNYIMTQVSLGVGTDNYIRPSTPAQVAAVIEPHLSGGAVGLTDIGSFILASAVSGATLITTAGSNLKLTMINPNTGSALNESGTVGVGTWRPHGRGYGGGYVTVWQRIA